MSRTAGPVQKDVNQPDHADGSRNRDGFLLVLAIVFSAGGVGAFIYLFVLHFNFYWLFLAPIIIALYQLPAVFVFWLYKKRRRGPGEKGESDEGPSGPGRD